MSNLFKLLQPKDYRSKIKLYCKYCATDKIIPNKLAQVENNGYVCRIIIKELNYGINN